MRVTPSSIARVALGVPVGLLLVFAVSCAANSRDGAAGNAQHQLVYTSTPLRSDAEADAVIALVKDAGRFGYTGLVIDARFDQILKREPEYIDRLRRIKTACKESNLQIIPRVFSLGYGGALLDNNPNMASVVPVTDVTMVVKGGRLAIQQTSEPLMRVGFESGARKQPDFRDDPGKLTVIDRAQRRAGSSSLRFEVGAGKSNRARALFRSEVTPFHSYVLGFWLKPGKGSGRPQVQVYGGRSHTLLKWTPRLKGDDWQRVEIVFNSMDYRKVQIYLGVWNSNDATFWVDDIELTEQAFTNAILRPSTPIKVARWDGTYLADRDVQVQPSVFPNFVEPRQTVNVRIRGKAVAEGERVRVSYFQAVPMKYGQIGVCVSVPELLGLFDRIVQRVIEVVEPDHFFLGLDEYRQGGWCNSCREGATDAGALLGNVVSRAASVVEKRLPGADVFLWSDMFDPGQNAVEQYYLVCGSLKESWRHLPRNVVMACWDSSRRRKSLDHFDREGFRTLACAYYDQASLDGSRRWLEALRSTPGAAGIMYTTWRNDYGQLQAFASMVASFEQN